MRGKDKEKGKGKGKEGASDERFIFLNKPDSNNFNFGSRGSERKRWTKKSKMNKMKV